MFLLAQRASIVADKVVLLQARSDIGLMSTSLTESGRHAVPEPGALPDSVWAQISSCMSLRDWARVSGTCKATMRVKLAEMEIADDFPRSGAGIAYQVHFDRQSKNENLCTYCHLHAPQMTGDCMLQVFCGPARG